MRGIRKTSQEDAGITQVRDGDGPGRGDGGRDEKTVLRNILSGGTETL